MTRSDMELRNQYLDTMGIQVWSRRGQTEVPAIENVPMVPEEFESGAIQDWKRLEYQVSGCTGCALHESRTNTVFGVGNQDASLLIIGEAPGAEEDSRGEPFVGRVGALLDQMLLALKLDRSRVFIANVLKCRPPGNRDPRPEETRSCLPYLNRQIALIKPSVVLIAGRVAAQALLDTEVSVGKLRGKLHHVGERVPAVVTYHPAYLLRQPLEKRKAWQDLCLAAQILKVDD